MINSYLHEIIPLKSVKNPLSDKASAPRLNLEKKIKNNFINTHQEWIFFGIQKAVVQTSKTNMYCTWLQGCQNVLSSRQIIMNSRRLWNSHQGTSSWGPWRLATFWNRYSPPRMPCCFVWIRAKTGNNTVEKTVEMSQAHRLNVSQI